MDKPDDFSFDPEILEAPELELSPEALKLKPEYIADTMDDWLSLPETGKMIMIKSMFDKDRASTSSSAPGSSSRENVAATFLNNRRPPLAPTIAPKDPGIERSNPALPDKLKVAHDPVQQVIPQFYFPHGSPPSNELKEECISRINKLFHDSGTGLRVDEFIPVTMEICGLPAILYIALFDNIDINGTGVVTRDAFINYWIDGNMLGMDTATQIFEILKQPDCDYLSQDDFDPILEVLVDTHPSLGFLATADEFRDRYIQTITHRIFYHLNKSQDGRLTLRELKNGNLVAAMHQVDVEVDINKVLRYFSYRHFFVIWSKFVELDTDEDFIISEEDLVRYDDYALSNRIIERIFSQVGRKFTSGVKGTMCYEDFVYFLLSEEDKLSEPGIIYWFNCLDLDADGVLTSGELKLFYKEQRRRLRSKCHEALPVEDMMCRIFDMIAPKNKEYITLADLKKSKLSGNVFDILFNVHKYQYPITYRQREDSPYLSHWDAFAERAYGIMVKRRRRNYRQNFS